MTASASDLSKLKIDRDAPPPAVGRATRRNAVLLGVAIALIAVVLVVLFGRGGGAATVQTMVVESTSSGGGGAATSVTANGYVVARTRASVSAKVPGRLTYLGVSEGSYVQAGQIMARLDNADYEAQVAQAEGNLASTRADLLEAEANHNQADREARRVREVRQQNAELISPRELDQAETAAATAAARARAAAARVQGAEAGLRYAHASLENTLVRAPFTGTVLRKEAEVGEVVAPSVGGGLTRGAVVTMADLTTLEVEVDVNEAYIARITSLQPARITLDAYPDTSFRGEVRQVVPTADRQRATVQVKVTILDRDPRILPEMGSRVDFLEPERPAEAAAPAAAPRPRVPASAVFDRSGETVVWLVRDGRLEARSVDAGPVSAGFREIRSGLAGGELIVTGGVESPAEGMRVRTANP